MTLTATVASSCWRRPPLFAEVDAAGMERIAERRGRGRVPRRPRHRPPGRDRDRVLRHRRPAAVRVVRDGDGHRPARSRRVLRRAVGARWPAARRPGRRRRTDDLPGPGLLGLRGGRRRGAGRRARRHARAGAPAARPDGRPATTDPSIGDRARRDARDRRSPTGGTATFLFSDIEGSTRLEERDRDRALRRRCASGTGRSCAPRSTAHGGSEQGTEGDSFFVVFASARDRRSPPPSTRSGRSPPSRGPRTPRSAVRMGLHSGEAGDGRRQPRRASTSTGRRGSPRPATAARSSLSDATRALVAAALPTGVSLRDLGEYRLRDLLAPERI